MTSPPPASNTDCTPARTLTIGTNGPFTPLLVTNGGTLTHVTTLTIGEALSAKTNRLFVTGTNSSLSGTNRLYVGNYGSGNQVFISQGGTLATAFGIVGFRAACHPQLSRAHAPRRR